jgi:hypothetical protein
MSYTGLSAWLSSLFPDKIFPIPTTGIDETINYIFDTDLQNFPKTGEKYIMSSQEFLYQTESELKRYPFEEIHLKVWNKFFSDNLELNIRPKSAFEQIDWNWLVQDFHLFIYRNVLKLYKNQGTIISLVDDFEPIAIEGQGKLAEHMRYERDNKLIRAIKDNAIKINPMLNCEVCGFSFFERYGQLGQGFIEAHHKKPLSETKERITTKDDIALVCSNCHKMIHKGISQLNNNTIMNIEELQALIK